MAAKLKKLQVSKGYQKKMQTISPFELKDKLLQLADEHADKNEKTMLNAGRGNPNWIATLPREAFFTLGLFGLEECKAVWDGGDHIAGIPNSKNAGVRFVQFLKKNAKAPGTSLLEAMFDYVVNVKQFDADEFVQELSEGIMGNQYPVPGRMLRFTEKIVHDYLVQEMCNGKPVKGQYDLFATEGGTAAMCYIFDSLQENFLLKKGDGIALMLPTFTPYIEIPELERYSFKVTRIEASEKNKKGYHLWQYPKEEVDKLKNKKVKALFVTNPSNPPSYILSPETIKQIVSIVKNDNPNLMIITDDVYGTFSNGFRSLMAELPQNTLCVYSFSKYFGATGWRLATVSLHQNNIYDKMIDALSSAQKGILNKRYSSLSLKPQSIKFIDRMVADSRQVALNHTAGLSLPQQIQMLLFAAFAILDKEGVYKKRMQDLIQKRLHALWDNSSFTLIENKYRVGYYTEIDMLEWGERIYGKAFAGYLQKNFEPVDIVFRLASETGIVLMNGGGFDGPVWSIRASLANLNETDYTVIGKAIHKILGEYAAAWKSAK